jgi:uncharacterized protein YbjT (DUF2867 family)
LGAAIGAGVLAQPACDAPISFVDTRDVAAVAAAVLRDEAYDEWIPELTGRAPATLQRFARDHRTAFAAP